MLGGQDLLGRGERGVSGPHQLERGLQRAQGAPVDVQRGGQLVQSLQGKRIPSGVLPTHCPGRVLRTLLLLMRRLRGLQPLATSQQPSLALAPGHHRVGHRTFRRHAPRFGVQREQVFGDPADRQIQRLDQCFQLRQPDLQPRDLPLPGRLPCRRAEVGRRLDSLGAPGQRAHPPGTVGGQPGGGLLGSGLLGSWTRGVPSDAYQHSVDHRIGHATGRRGFQHRCHGVGDAVVVRDAELDVERLNSINGGETSSRGEPGVQQAGRGKRGLQQVELLGRQTVDRLHALPQRCAERAIAIGPLPAPPQHRRWRRALGLGADSGQPPVGEPELGVVVLPEVDDAHAQRLPPGQRWLRPPARDSGGQPVLAVHPWFGHLLVPSSRSSRAVTETTVGFR